MWEWGERKYDPEHNRMKERIAELEAELARSNKLLTHSGIVKAQEEYNRLALDNARLRELLKRIADRHRPGYDHLAAEIAREAGE